MHEMIKHNAHQIRELHHRLHQAFHVQPHGPDHKRACEEFHVQYDALAFPGGYENGLQRISDGDPETIETAIAFLEVKPYFFRSQYMRTKLIRLLKKADLTKSQRRRFDNALK